MVFSFYVIGQSFSSSCLFRRMCIWLRRSTIYDVNSRFPAHKSTTSRRQSIQFENNNNTTEGRLPSPLQIHHVAEQGETAAAQSTLTYRTWTKWCSYRKRRWNGFEHTSSIWNPKFPNVLIPGIAFRLFNKFNNPMSRYPIFCLFWKPDFYTLYIKLMRFYFFK